MARGTPVKFVPTGDVSRWRRGVGVWFPISYFIHFISYLFHFFFQRRLLSRGRDAELVFEDMMREARRIFEQAAAVGDRLPYCDPVNINA